MQIIDDEHALIDVTKEYPRNKEPSETMWLHSKRAEFWVDGQRAAMGPLIITGRKRYESAFGVRTVLEAEEIPVEYIEVHEPGKPVRELWKSAPVR